MSLQNENGASVVISHQIIPGQEKEYELWLAEIAPLCRSYAGNIDWQIIKPIAGITSTYTVIIRFDTVENLKAWMDSDDRRNLIWKAQPLFAKDDKYVIKSGLDFLFLDDQPKAAPKKWKQFLVTWSAIYPLSILVPLLIIPSLNALHFPDNKYLISLIGSGCIVSIMVYLLMPNYTRLIKKWLFK